MFSYPYYTDSTYLKQLDEKKDIRRTANITGVVFIVMSVIMCYWGYLYTWIMYTFFPYHYSQAVALVTDSTTRNLFQIVISSIALIIPYTVFARVMGQRVGDLINLNKPKEKGLMLPFVLLGLSFCGFSNFATNIAGSIFESFGFHYQADIHSQDPTNIYGIILSVLATAVTPAIVEEFAMRGMLMGVLRKHGDGVAIAASSLVFALMHGNFEQIPFAFLLGLFFAYSVIKTKTLWTAVIIHFLNNFLSVVFGYVAQNISSSEANVLFIFYMIVLIAIGFIALLLLRKHPRSCFALEKKEFALSDKERAIAFFTAPGMIISYLVVVYEAFFVYGV